MTIQKFEDIIAWQKAQDLSVDIYNIFREIRDYSFRDQICRASVSVSNNIAEGFDRAVTQILHASYIWLSAQLVKPNQ